MRVRYCMAVGYITKLYAINTRGCRLQRPSRDLLIFYDQFIYTSIGKMVEILIINQVYVVYNKEL
ncbi:hypothetical protein ACFLZA_03350, partial [Candidatus Neomarinimicrobiota bacterium]